MYSNNPSNITRLSFVPGEIHEDILRWLPVKSLLKFRCVSKSWRTLIDSERFVKIHLETSKRHPTFAHHRVIISNDGLPPEKPILSHCSLGRLVSEPSIQFFLDDPVPDSASSIYMVGSCNGLICILVDRKYFYLWNPSLRISKKLSFFDDHLKDGRVIKFGFGYLESAQDYKIYGALTGILSARTSKSARKIYSLKSDSWSTAKESTFNFEIHGGGLGMFVNGRLHWTGQLCSNPKNFIFSYDLMTEEHEMVQLPSEASDLEDDYCHLMLGDFSGCLCMVQFHPDEQVDVWVMKQYGVKESWIKMMTVPNPYHTINLSFKFFMNKNREILISFQDDLAIVRLEDSTLWYAPRRFGVCSALEQVVYVESLVSFVQRDGKERQE